MLASFDQHTERERERERERVGEVVVREVFIMHPVMFGVLIHFMIFTIISQSASCTNFNMLRCGCCPLSNYPWYFTNFGNNFDYVAILN